MRFHGFIRTTSQQYYRFLVSDSTLPALEREARANEREIERRQHSARSNGTSATYYTVLNLDSAQNYWADSGKQYLPICFKGYILIADWY
jgi:hypothetical protein